MKFRRSRAPPKLSNWLMDFGDDYEKRRGGWGGGGRERTMEGKTGMGASALQQQQQPPPLLIRPASGSDVNARREAP